MKLSQLTFIFVAFILTTSLAIGSSEISEDKIFPISRGMLETDSPTNSLVCYKVQSCRQKIACGKKGQNFIRCGIIDEEGRDWSGMN